MKKPYIPSHIAAIADDPQLDTLADMLRSALSAVREHLELDIAYMSEFVDDDTVFREVVAPKMTDMIADGNLGDGLQVGKSLPKMETYCHHIMEGLLPALITDTSEVEVSRNLQVTQDLRIAAHVGIPIVLKDGTKFGMFCGISHTPKPGMNERDLRVMQMFANMVTEHLDSKMVAHQQSGRMRDRIDALVDQNDFEIAYQPILNIHEMRPVGYEALCRFTGTGRAPDVWFAEADDVGRLQELEMAVIRKALNPLSGLYPLKFISINASPETAISDEFRKHLMKQPLDRIVLEITEHAQVDSYEDLMLALKPLRRRGMRLAVDDAGAGYSSMRHILKLRPDIIKLDMSITRDLDKHPSHCALVRAMVHFSNEMQGHVVAEGIETQVELETLRSLGVQKGQGYFLGRPKIGMDKANGFKPSLIA